VTSLNKRLGMLSTLFSRTPVVQLPDDELNLFAKLEFANPAGSTKDRPAFWILKQAIERGEVTGRTTVVESSSGNFARSMAWFCQLLGLRFHPVIDPNCNAPVEMYLRMLCPRLDKVETPDGLHGFLGARLRRVHELCRELDDAYWSDQYHNPDAVAGHYQLTGGEIVDSFPVLDYMFVAVSTGGTIAGLSRRLKEAYPAITVVAVDAEGSVIFGGQPAKRHIPGIGSGIVPPLLRDALIDDVVTVPEWQAAAHSNALLREHGLYVGGSTGSVYAAIRMYFAAHPPAERRRQRGDKPTVLFLCADDGSGYADTIYNPEWVAAHLREPAGHTNLAWSPPRPSAGTHTEEAFHVSDDVGQLTLPGLRVISGAEVAAHIDGSRAELLDIVRRAYLTHDQGASVNPHSGFLRIPGDDRSRIISLPAFLGGEFGVVGIKWIASFPANSVRGIPRASAVLVLNDLETGYPAVCMESSIISATRTAASAVLAAEALVGSRSVSRVGVIGAGLIAGHVWEFLCDLGWEIGGFRLFDINRSAAERFAQRLVKDGAADVAVVDAVGAFADCELVVLATVAGKPHIEDPGVLRHAPAVLHLSLRDLAPAVIQAGQNFTDDIDHVLRERTSLQLTEQETGDRGFITGTIADLLNGKVIRDCTRAAIFSPFGLGVLDLAVGSWVRDQVEAAAGGVYLPEFFGDAVRQP
jgi:N-[(2S)-2-amino-2-carboxyethyl]-L-glutamate dehydrogenase